MSISGTSTNERRVLHLLDAARSRIEPRGTGPRRQVDLRRAVSDAYYAAFHFLIDRCTQCCLGSQPSDARYRDAVARGFKHSVMQKACRTFGSAGPLPKPLRSAYPVGTSPEPGVPAVPVSVRKFATQFVVMQEKRHAADYDWSRTFRLNEVEADIEVTAEVIDAFAAEPRSADVRFFLTAVTVWPGLSN